MTAPAAAMIVAVAVAVAVALALALLSPRLAQAQGKDLDGVVNLNTAGSELLELLPGVGPAKVRSIVWYRQRHPFRTVDELVRIKGIGRKMVRRLRIHLAISGPTTARALHRPRGAEPPPAPPAPPPPRKPAAPTSPSRAAPAPSRAAPAPAPLAARHPAVAPLARGRPWPPTRGERDRAAANHCARPP